MTGDWIGWIIGGIAVAFAVNAELRLRRMERQARGRRDIAHAALVSLKPAIQGDNKDRVIAAINDVLEKLKD